MTSKKERTIIRMIIQGLLLLLLIVVFFQRDWLVDRYMYNYFESRLKELGINPDDAESGLMPYEGQVYMRLEEMYKIDPSKTAKFAENIVMTKEPVIQVYPALELLVKYEPQRAQKISESLMLNPTDERCFALASTVIRESDASYFQTALMKIVENPAGRYRNIALAELMQSPPANVTPWLGQLLDNEIDENMRKSIATSLGETCDSLAVEILHAYIYREGMSINEIVTGILALSKCRNESIPEILKPLKEHPEEMVRRSVDSVLATYEQ